MHEALNRNIFFVKERVGMLKAVNEYDILDPETEETLMTTSEEIGIISKIFRFTDYKRMTPFNITVHDKQGNQVLRVSRGVSIFGSTVTVHDENDNPIGVFKQKLFSIGGSFRLLDMEDNEVGNLKGKWTSWEFTFRGPGDVQLGMVTKKWAGLGKELFTSADNYVLTIEDAVPFDNPVRALIMAAVMCIDMVLAE